MTHKLLIIDPQNDFCDIPGAALPVRGAHQDMRRLARFVWAATTAGLSSLIVTLDWHEPVAIERVSFWGNAQGKEVAPGTVITEAAVRAGQFIPKDLTLLDEVLAYLHQLESGGRYQLIVWPVHCVADTWGANVHTDLHIEVRRWEVLRGRLANYVRKGMNPLTEQYSAVRAEVPRADDPRTQTNQALLEAVAPADGEILFVAGEAASHCVPCTMAHVLEALPSEEAHSRVVLLTDCMSPVPGFEQATEQFFTRMREAGVQLKTSQLALNDLMNPSRSVR